MSAFALRETGQMKPAIASFLAALALACGHATSPRDSLGARSAEAPAPVIAVIRCDFDAIGEATGCTPAWNRDSAGRQSPDSLQRRINYASLKPRFIVADSTGHSSTALMDLANLLGQPIGTLNGRDQLGVKAIFTSIRITRGTGSVRLVNSDGTLILDDTVAPYLSYDSLIAASRSSKRSWRFMTSDSASAFTVWIKIQAHFPAESNVTLTPPDSIPSWIHANANIAGPTDSVHTRFVNRIIVVRFRSTASLLDRQLAIASVDGTVVGGDPNPDGSGPYYVRVTIDETGSKLFGAARDLRLLPQIENAYPEIVLEPLSRPLN